MKNKVKNGTYSAISGTTTILVRLQEGLLLIMIKSCENRGSHPSECERCGDFSNWERKILLGCKKQERKKVKKLLNQLFRIDEYYEGKISKVSINHRRKSALIELVKLLCDKYEINTYIELDTIESKFELNEKIAEICNK